MNEECNFLFVGTNSVPGYTQFFDLNTGLVLPTYKSEVNLAPTEIMAGAIE